MADPESERLFARYFPKITEVTIVQAAKEWSIGNEILSLDGQRTALDAFVFQLATDSETVGPFLLNSLCARELCARLLDAGFGPQQTDVQ
jgi:hypothetical protein